MPVLSERFAAAPDVHARAFEVEIVILDLHGGNYYGLDEVGASVWSSLVTGGLDLGEVIERLSQEYDVDKARLSADIVALVNDLLAHGLLVRRA